jgi:hypothetical protein
MEMLYEDKFGKLMMPEEVEELSPLEIEEKRIHAFNSNFHIPEFF